MRVSTTTLRRLQGWHRDSSPTLTARVEREGRWKDHSGRRSSTRSWRRVSGTRYAQRRVEGTFRSHPGCPLTYGGSRVDVTPSHSTRGCHRSLHSPESSPERLSTCVGGCGVVLLTDDSVQGFILGLRVYSSFTGPRLVE